MVRNRNTTSHNAHFLQYAASPGKPHTVRQWNKGAAPAVGTCWKKAAVGLFVLLPYTHVPWAGSLGTPCPPCCLAVLGEAARAAVLDGQGGWTHGAPGPHILIYQEPQQKGHNHPNKLQQKKQLILSFWWCLGLTWTPYSCPIITVISWL